jgi:hypothetical protein
MPIRLGRGVLWSTNAAVAAVASCCWPESCCCVVMNLCYQVSHGPFCVASSTAFRNLVMLLKNHISAAIKDKYEEAARWLLYTYLSYILSQVGYLPDTWAPAHRRLSFSARRREDSNLLISIIAAKFCTAYLDSFASLGC